MEADIGIIAVLITTVGVGVAVISVGLQQTSALGRRIDSTATDLGQRIDSVQEHLGGLRERVARLEVIMTGSVADATPEASPEVRAASS